MPWYVWVVLAAFAFGTFASIVTIGKPREPRTPSDVVVGLVINGLTVWAILALAGHCA